jgi:hypothetical protein
MKDGFMSIDRRSFLGLRPNWPKPFRIDPIRQNALLRPKLPFETGTSGEIRRWPIN